MNGFLIWLWSSLAKAEPEYSPVPWTKEQAHSLDKGEKETGIFGPLRLGFGKGWEGSIQPVLFFWAPGAMVKKELWGEGNHQLALSSGGVYAAPLLNLLAREGIGGVLAPDIVVPKLPKLKLIGHYTFQPNQHGLSLWQRLDVVPGAGQYDDAAVLDEGGFPYTSIDAPMAYSRTVVFRSGIGLQTGLIFHGSFAARWQYECKSAIWVHPNLDEHQWSVEEQLMLRFLPKPDRAVQIGAVYTVSDFPYGRQWHLLPTLDVRWFW